MPCLDFHATEPLRLFDSILSSNLLGIGPFKHSCSDAKEKLLSSLGSCNGQGKPGGISFFLAHRAKKEAGGLRLIHRGYLKDIRIISHT